MNKNLEHVVKYLGVDYVVLQTATSNRGLKAFVKNLETNQYDWLWKEDMLKKDNEA